MIAQLVEQLTTDPEIEGSNPAPASYSEKMVEKIVVVTTKVGFESTYFMNGNRALISKKVDCLSILDYKNPLQQNKSRLGE